MPAPPAALVELFSRDAFAARWHDLIDYARTDTFGFGFWAAVWAGSFCITFLLLRMLFTRWGETNVTQKTMALSLLAHMIFAMLSTRMVFSHGGALSGRGSGREIVVRPAVRNVAEGESSAVSRLPGRSPVWERPPDPAAVAPARSARAPSETLVVPVPEREAEPAAESVPLPLPQFPAAEPPRPVPVPERAANPAPALPAPGAAIAEETAAARPDPAAAAGGAQRTARDIPELPASEPIRGARPPVGGEPTAVEIPAPLAGNDPSAADPPAAVRLPQPGRRPVTKGSSPDVGPIAESNEQPDGSGTKVPSAPARSFSRSGRPATQDPLADSVDRRRTPDSLPQVPGAPGPLVPSRVGADSPADVPRPEVVRPDIESPIDRNSIKVPEPYKLRGLPGRKQFAIDMGATDESERAVAASLEWLVRHQHPKGYWPPIESTLGREPNEQLFGDELPLRQRSGLQAESGLTALALLAFLGANCTHEDNLYADNVDRALRWLISQQESDGYLGGRANKYAGMYCHGMATIALGEAYGMTKDPALRDPLVKAVQYIIEQQNPTDGGWRYTKSKFEGDMSMFGWQLMALKSANTAGLKVPREPVQRAFDFLNANSNEMKTRGLSKHGGLAAYQRKSLYRPTRAMTAEALFCKQMLRFERDDEAVVEAVEYLQDHLPRRAQQDLYYWYYGTLAMYHHGGEPWRRWNNALRDTLVDDQRTDGDFAGSWNPRVPWGDYGGRVFSTALSTLCLEVYYRYLPLYQMGGKATTGQVK